VEPFQLLCPGCASKLKVRNRSAIGQRLACPKCREMILVEAPEGHDIGESKAATASFDDMDLDALLDNRPPIQPPAKPRKQPENQPKQQKPVTVSINVPKPASKRPTSSAGTNPRTPSANSAAPKPGEDWVNPATKKKQRFVLTVMAAVGAILAAAAMLVLALYGFGSDENQVAKATDENRAEESIVDPGEVSTDRAETVAETETDSNSDPDSSESTRQQDIKAGTQAGAIAEPPEDDLPDVPDIGDASPMTRLQFRAQSFRPTARLKDSVMQ